jgi:hypothetical protein
VLQVFGGLDALGQLGLETGQRFTRQRRAGLGGVTLPGGGVGQIQRRLGQQCLGLGHPFHGDGVLVLGAAQLVQASRTTRAAPLSRAFISLNTSCSTSWAGDVASQSRRRAARSPEVSAEKAPPVTASSGWASGFWPGSGSLLGLQTFFCFKKVGT